jgi:hypothetical protein
MHSAANNTSSVNPQKLYAGHFERALSPPQPMPRPLPWFRIPMFLCEDTTKE